MIVSILDLYKDYLSLYAEQEQEEEVVKEEGEGEGEGEEYCSSCSSSPFPPSPLDWRRMAEDSPLYIEEHFNQRGQLQDLVDAGM